MTMTPMVFTARMMKQDDPDRPHRASSAPAPPRSWRPPAARVRSDVDFVLTFEELAGIIEGKDLDIDSAGSG